MDIANKLKVLIAEGKTEYVINELLLILKDFDKDLYNSIIMLSGQYNQWKNSDLINLGPDKTELRKIEYSVLLLISKLESNNNLINHYIQLKHSEKGNALKTKSSKRINLMILIVVIFVSILFGLIYVYWKSTDNQKQYLLAYENANKYFESGDYNEAINQYNKALSYNSNDSIISRKITFARLKIDTIKEYSKKAEILIYQGKSNLAIEYYQKLLKIDSYNERNYLEKINNCLAVNKQRQIDNSNRPNDNKNRKQFNFAIDVVNAQNVEVNGIKAALLSNSIQGYLLINLFEGENIISVYNQNGELIKGLNKFRVNISQDSLTLTLQNMQPVIGRTKVNYK